MNNRTFPPAGSHPAHRRRTANGMAAGSAFSRAARESVRPPLIRIALALTSAAFLALSGCAGLEDLVKKPTARITSIEFAGMDFDSVSLVVHIEIDNPNPIGLSLAAYDYGLDAWNSTVVEGRQEEKISLRADGKSSFPVPVELDFADLTALGGSALTADSVPLGIRLGLEIDIPYLNRVRLDLSGSVELPIPRLPMVIPRNLRVDRVGLGGASVTLTCSVENPNVFPLTLKSLDGSVEVAGAKWGRAGISRPLELDADGRGSVEIALEVDFGEVGRSAWSLLTGAGRADVKLSGSMDVDADLPGFDGSGIPWDADAGVSIVR